jgi:hypothetical protein
MGHEGAAPQTPSRAARVRAHSVVVTLLTLVVTLTLADQLSTRLGAQGVAGAPRSPTPETSAAASVPALSPSPSAAPDLSPHLVYAAGDIADCPDTVPAVARLVRNRHALILAVGDIVYPSGQPRGFERCFDPVWGALKPRIRPVPGNHDYITRDAAGYFAYFGAAAGDPSQGWYSFDIGSWHIVALNSMCQYVGGCRAGSPQITWLEADLAAHPSGCTLAYWHHPRFTSGDGASPQRTGPMWEALYGAGAEIVINGHDHDYERFAPLDPAGRVDPQRGIREFVVGTGGANLTRRVRDAPHSEIWTRAYYGLLELTLRPGRYHWRFVAAETQRVIDAGSGRCH